MTKGVEETIICFIKIQSENMKITWNISLIIFCMIFNFSKRDGFTVMRRYTVIRLLCGIKFIASPLQPCYFDTKITSEKTATLMNSGFSLVDSKLEVYQE